MSSYGTARRLYRARCPCLCRRLYGPSLNRPQFTKLRELVRQRVVHAVFVDDPDRLARKLAHQILLTEEFEQAGVVLRLVTMPDGARTPEAQLLTNVRGI